MKFTSLALMASCFTSVIAFAPSSTLNTNTITAGSIINSKLHAVKPGNGNGNGNDNDWMESIQKNLKGAATATLLASAIWASPTAILGNTNDVHGNVNNPLLQQIQSSVMADAKEMASGSGSRVNKDAESLLRLGLPIPKDKEVSTYLVIVDC